MKSRNKFVRLACYVVYSCHLFQRLHCIKIRKKVLPRCWFNIRHINQPDPPILNQHKSPQDNKKTSWHVESVQEEFILVHEGHLNLGNSPICAPPMIYRMNKALCRLYTADDARYGFGCQSVFLPFSFLLSVTVSPRSWVICWVNVLKVS